MSLTISVIVVTWNRPTHVRTCIEHLLAQVPAPNQIVVVDASPGTETQEAVAAFPSVEYIANPLGRGNTMHSRNTGIMASTGDIISFIDDDAYAHPGWLANLVSTYTDATIGAVGGRVLDNIPGEETDGVHQLGRLKPNGVVCAHFGGDPGRILDVDHMLGANMSYRREVMAELGGFHEDFPGTNACDDTDTALRVKRLGYRILFNPLACVDHRPAPRARGARFDNRYMFYHRSNNFMMFIRNYGFRAIIWRYLLFTSLQSITEFARKIGGAVVRIVFSFAGVAYGIVRGTGIYLRERRNPRRTDAAGGELTRILKSTGSARTD